MDENDIPPLLREILRGIGLDEPNLEEPLHAKLVEKLHELGPNATAGKRLTTMRWVFAWELKDAGQVFATAKSDYERYIDRKTVKLRADGEKITRAEAEQIARADDEAYRLKLAFLLAEQRERAMRNFLATIQSAQDDARTDRADARAGNTAHAHGYDGGA